MNWSTRLRRWDRIRTPPVRDPSMKPSAATVLPDPVACSNQKRRLAPGSSGAAGTRSPGGSPPTTGRRGYEVPGARLPIGGLLLVGRALVLLDRLDGSVPPRLAVRGDLAVGLA